MTALTSSFTTRELPWMKLGAIIDDPSVTAHEAARLGGIDFEVEFRQSAFRGTDGKSWITVPNRHALVRKDRPVFFDYVSSVYAIVQYADAFDFMDQVNPRYVAAGALNGGRQGFMVVQFEGHESLDPAPRDQSDPHDLYVILRTSHDRSRGLEVAVLPLRNRCMNQLGLALNTFGVKQRWSIKHVGEPLTKLKTAQDTLTKTASYVTAFETAVRQLTSVNVSRDDTRIILKRVLPNRPRRDAQISAIEAAFGDSPYVGFGGTGWGLVNAVSEYFEHGRDAGTRTAQSRFTDGFEGQTAKWVGRTAQLILNRA